MEKQRDLLENLFEKESEFTILLLDACRYDEFKKYRSEKELEGDLEKVDSECINTMEWIENNWDILNQIEVYSAHPRYKAMGYAVHSVWLNEENKESYMQSRLKNLSMPEEVISELLSDDPSRSLLHFILPHTPFVGKKGMKVDVPDIFKQRGTRGKFYTLVGQIQGWDRLKELYRDNLERAMEPIEVNLEKFREPVIITSDHGEMIGEHNRYGHNYSHEVIKTIPWFRWSE